MLTFPALIDPQSNRELAQATAICRRVARRQAQLNRTPPPRGSFPAAARLHVASLPGPPVCTLLGYQSPSGSPLAFRCQGLSCPWQWCWGQLQAAQDPTTVGSRRDPSAVGQTQMNGILHVNTCPTTVHVDADMRELQTQSMRDTHPHMYIVVSDAATGGTEAAECFVEMKTPPWSYTQHG